VAALPHTYRWGEPADYQYIAHDSRPPEEQGGCHITFEQQ
jgi:hypothetical protein